jgi:hypothetical protein
MQDCNMQLIQKIRRFDAFPFFVLIAAPLVLLSPVLTMGKALFWGIPALQFVPWWKWAYDTLLSGHLPFWNPLLGMGAPFIANYQSALFYPPNWTYFLFYVAGGITGLAWSQALVLAIHLTWSGFGMALLMRRLGSGKLGQTISGLAFGLSGYLVARAWFASINAAVAWLPWILLLSFDLVKDQSKPKNIIKLGISIGMQLLAGHAQISWYTLLLTGIWISFWGWQNQTHNQKGKIRALLKIWLGLALATGLGVVIASVQLLPTAEYLLQSQRSSAVDYEAAMTYSFWPWRLLGFIAPDLFGSPVIGDYWGYANFWEDAIYIGLLPFLLAFGVILGGIFRNRSKTAESGQQCTDGINCSSVIYRSLFPLVYLLISLIIVSFLLALGKNTPIFPWLYRHIPTFDMFNSPTRFSVWAVFSLALLAGIGAEHWRRPVKRGLYWTRLATAGAFAISLGAGLGWFVLRDVATDFHPSFVRGLALTGFWGLGSGVLALLAPRKDSQEVNSGRLWQWTVVLWVATDLIFAGWGLNPGIPLDFYTEIPPNKNQIQEIVGDGRMYLLGDDEETIRYKQYFIFESFDPGRDWINIRAIQLPNLNLLDGIPMANNYDPMVPGRYARWMKEISGMDIPLRDDLLDLMGISVFESDDPAGNFGVAFDPRKTAARVRWVPCARYVDDEESAWNLIFSGAVDLQAEVILEKAAHSQTQDCNPWDGNSKIVGEDPNHVTIQIDSQSPGWIELSDIWYPGWRASVDGTPTLMFRADYLFRAVEVPAGSHTVEFSYRPVWFYAGSGISLVAWLGVAIFFIRQRQKK